MGGSNKGKVSHMEKAAAFMFYPKDWLADCNVRLMTFAERGMYFDLLCYCWLNNGSLPDNTQALANLIGTSLEEFEAAWPQIKPCFRRVRNNRLIQRRLLYEKKKQAVIRRQRSEAGKQGMYNRWRKQLENKELNNSVNGFVMESNSSVITNPITKNNFPIPNNNIVISKEITIDFDHFWSAYPRKVGKQKCLRWWKSHKPDTALVEKMLAAIARQKLSRQWQDPQYIPHPYTWLNQGRWEDEPIGMPTPIGPEYTPDPERLAHLKEIERQAREGRQQ